MTPNPYKIWDPKKSDEENLAPDPITKIGQQFIAQAEAAREKDRPMDAVRGALAKAFKDARVPGASKDQNMIAGIAAASAKLAELSQQDQPKEIADVLAVEAERIGTIKDRLEGIREKDAEAAEQAEAVDKTTVAGAKRP